MLTKFGWLGNELGMRGSRASRRQGQCSLKLICPAQLVPSCFGLELMGDRSIFNLGLGEITPNWCSMANPKVENFNFISMLPLISETATSIVL